MTTELEEQFFKVFEIEPESGYWCKRFDETSIVDCNGIKEPSKKCAKCENGYIKYRYYPVITAEKLLQMICILGTAIRHFKIPPKLKLEQLKYHILRNCINEQEGIYTRIQQLFKEEE